MKQIYAQHSGNQEYARSKVGFWQVSWAADGCMLARMACENASEAAEPSVAEKLTRGLAMGWQRIQWGLTSAFRPSFLAKNASNAIE